MKTRVLPIKEKIVLVVALGCLIFAVGSMVAAALSLPAEAFIHRRFNEACACNHAGDSQYFQEFAR